MRSTLVVCLPPEQKKGVRFSPRPSFKMKFIDVHSHLEACEDIPWVIENCREKKVEIVTCGTDIETNRKTLELKKKYPEIEICLGIYPLDCVDMTDEEIDKEIKFIKENKDKIFGIGEVGLDKHALWDDESFGKQKKTLRKFVELAKNLNKPIFIHSREAEKESIELLEEFEYDKIVMHCFSGGMKLVKKIIENNWMLSIPASVKYNEHFQKIIETVPIKSLLCETDAPFLHPDKVQGMKNNSSNVLESYKKIAEIKGLSLKEVEGQIYNNFESLK